MMNKIYPIVLRLSIILFLLSLVFVFLDLDAPEKIAIYLSLIINAVCATICFILIKRDKK